MNWYSSDLHLGHKAVIAFCDRPYRSTEEMDEDLIKRFNNQVKPEDTLYLLGDVSFHKPAHGIPLMARLNGRKILVRGNHDKYSGPQYLSAGFAAVVHEAVIEIAGKRVRLCHFPLYDAASARPFLGNRPVLKNGEFLLCGHVHQGWKTRGMEYNVGVDVHHYQPVSQSQIESWMAKVAKNRDLPIETLQCIPGFEPA